MLNEIMTAAAGVLIAGILVRGRADRFAHVANLRELGALACGAAWHEAFENFFTCKKFSGFQKCASKAKMFRRLRTAPQGSAPRPQRFFEKNRVKLLKSS